METMNTSKLQSIIDAAWEGRDAITTGTTGDVRDAVNTAMDLLDSGQVRVAERQDVGK